MEYKGPWPKQNAQPAVVLAVSEGWVRYSIGQPHLSMFPDERMRVHTFNEIYPHRSAS